MRFYIVSPLKIIHRSNGELTYHSEQKLDTGQIVTVPVGSIEVAGVVIKATTKPGFATKPIASCLESVVLPSELISLHSWLSRFYVSHPVSVWQTMLPNGITRKRRPVTKKDSRPCRKRANFVLNSSQSSAIASIWKRRGTSLLHGITGSGKTAVYIELAKKTLSEKRSVIILVPEIALTPQLVAEFTHHIPDILITHSGLSPAKRHLVWLEAMINKKPCVVIGPRSAIFSPINSLGLIVVDECHEPSYKQEKSPRYSTLRAASVLAKLHDARLVLGSATPAVQDYFLAEKNDSASIIDLKRLAHPNAITPEVELIDMTNRYNFKKSKFLSDQLLAAICEAVSAKKQSLIFHNRRGSAPITLCENCGWSASCTRCFSPMTLHDDAHILRCHICNYFETVSTACPACGHASIIHKGIGTKRVADELSAIFPRAKIARFDGDNQPENSVSSLYQQLYDGDIDIIVGTQVVAKGLDLPLLRFVGVVQADSGLSLPDYQSSERVFQLLAQVSGRVGRNENPSKVIVQSYQPSHPSVQFGLAQDYRSFYISTLEERRRSNFPPYCYLLKMVCMYRSESAAIRAAKRTITELGPYLKNNMIVLGPAPAFYERVRDKWRWQIIIKSPSRSALIDLTAHIPAPHWQIELDPASLL